jgi:aromatic-L-amino-acid decarboxylase
MTPEEFRAAGHELVDWIADLRAGLADRPVLAQVQPGEVRAAMPPVPPPGGSPIDGLLAQLDTVVLPGMTHLQHPRSFAFFPANASLASVLGDLTSTGLGALGISWESCPALTEVEEVVVGWMQELTGLDSGWHGTIQDTASTACLVALLSARERATGYSLERGGLQAEDRPMTVYCSVEAHSSVRKAALLAGFGEANLRLVGLERERRGMDLTALARAMAEDQADGRRPAAVVATVGTTATTGLDDIAGVVALAREHGAWVHVDGAMAGSALLLDECRSLFAGLEGADSFTWNPHKWMGTALDCSLYYVRDVDHLTRVMGSAPSYLRGAGGDAVPQYRDWGLPLGRRFRALKLWFHLHLDGIDTIRARLRRDLDNARWLAKAVAATEGWELVAPVPLQTVVVRHRPVGADGGPLAGDPLDDHTRAWVADLNRSGAAYLTPAIVDGAWAARVSIGAEPTERSDVDAVWALMQATAADAAGRITP